MSIESEIACIACGTCVRYCPEQIAIPEYLGVYNESLSGQYASALTRYKEQLMLGGKPDNCVLCAKCERQCPQHLPIRKLLMDIKYHFVDE